jgi:hypothetical protein
MRWLLLGAAGGLVVAATLALHELRPVSTPAPVPPAAQAQAESRPEAPAAPAAVARRALPPATAPRPAVPQLRSERDVQVYLGDVEQRLRRSGQLSATEIEPAFDAIRRAGAEVGPQARCRDARRVCHAAEPPGRRDGALNRAGPFMGS